MNKLLVLVLLLASKVACGQVGVFPADPVKPTSPCNTYNIGSTKIQTWSNTTPALCAGADCKGNKISVSYIKYHDFGQYIWQCKLVKEGSLYKPEWAQACMTEKVIERACKPKVLPCPYCKGQPPRYWTSPIVENEGYDVNTDTCKGKTFDPMTASAIAANIASGNGSIGNEDNAYKSLTDRITGMIDTQPVCIADPDGTSN